MVCLEVINPEVINALSSLSDEKFYALLIATLVSQYLDSNQRC